MNLIDYSQPKPFRPLTYVACPYSSPVVNAGEIKLARFRAVTLASAMLAKIKGWNPFSPITHSHPMHADAGLEGDWEFWKKIDTEYLQCSCRMVIVTLDGWEESVGVTAEQAIARELQIPILHMTEPEVKTGLETRQLQANAWLTDNHTGEFLSYVFTR